MHPPSAGADVYFMTTDAKTCNLCGALEARVRSGRLGRYSCTCDRCETRRGTHLVRTDRGYASRTQLQTL